MAKIEINQQTMININMPISVAVANANAGIPQNQGSTKVEEDVSLLKERIAALKEQLRDAKELIKYYKERVERYRQSLRIIARAAEKRDLTTIRNVIRKLNVK